LICGRSLAPLKRLFRNQGLLAFNFFHRGRSRVCEEGVTVTAEVVN
jgi:hypothetical protein